MEFRISKFSKHRTAIFICGLGLLFFMAYPATATLYTEICCPATHRIESVNESGSSCCIQHNTLLNISEDAGFQKFFPCECSLVPFDSDNRMPVAHFFSLKSFPLPTEARIKILSDDYPPFSFPIDRSSPPAQPPIPVRLNCLLL